MGRVRNISTLHQRENNKDTIKLFTYSRLVQHKYKYNLLPVKKNVEEEERNNKEKN